MLNIHNVSPFKYFELKRFRHYCNSTLILNGVDDKHSRGEITNCLEALYSGKNRHYHTWYHILFMFDKAIEYFPGPNPGDAIDSKTFLTPSELLAILFHDAIYVPDQKDNEGRSIDLMVSLMAGFGVPLTEFCWASRCIKETANFNSIVRDESTHAVLDLDLCALANPYNDFIIQNRLISKEFPNIPEIKRKKFLYQFLSKKKIFYKLTHLEEKARNNIKKYVENP